jgi:hypothetical protein
MKDLENLTKLAESETNSSCSSVKKSQTDTLLDLCKDIELFHSETAEPYASFVQRNHTETWPLKSSEFKGWLRQQFYLQTGGAPTDRALQDALQTLAAKALYEGQKHKVHLRIAHSNDKIYLDLANSDWQVIEISIHGFQIKNESPVKFRRVSGMEALPLPVPGEHPSIVINHLRSFLNVESDDDFKLLVGWLLSSVGTQGPYIVLVLYGEQGTAKSTSVRVLRSLVDPNASPLRRPPKNTDDLMVMAKSNFIVALDNMSFLAEWLSDDLCVLSTGGGLSKRKHYSDDEEVVLDARRPIIANGIDEFVARGDLASRSIFLHLPLIQGNARMSEKDFWLAFSNLCPSIFCALIFAVIEGMRNIDSIVLPENPRMVDAWRFITAAEAMFGWPRGSCFAAFQRNQRKGNDVLLNSSPLYPFIRTIAEVGFMGTSQDLLAKIKLELQQNNVPYSEQRLFPNTPKALSDRLRRLAPALRLDGIEITFEKTQGSNSQRLVRIVKSENLASQATLK